MPVENFFRRIIERGGIVAGLTRLEKTSEVTTLALGPGLKARKWPDAREFTVRIRAPQAVRETLEEKSKKLIEETSIVLKSRMVRSAACPPTEEYDVAEFHVIGPSSLLEKAHAYLNKLK